MIPIVPAVIPTSEADAKATLEKLHFSLEVHVDVVDGIFAPTPSWPYQPAGTPVAIKPQTDAYTLEVDLMVMDPLPAAVDWVTAGADMLVFHAETVTLDNFKQFAEFSHCTVGVAIHGATPLDTLLEYAAFADYVQLMGIEHIGSQGQPFDESVLEKIAQVQADYPDKLVSVDGSVNEHTITRLKAAGVDRCIVGSAITLAPQPAVAYESLSALIN